MAWDDGDSDSICAALAAARARTEAVTVEEKGVEKLYALRTARREGWQMLWAWRHARGSAQGVP